MEQRRQLSIRDIVLCALFSALIAVGAFIKIPVPMIPFTLQFLFTNLAGLLLGKKLGSISVAIYIAIGLMGLPVFTQGGGPGYVFQPTFGYIMGFLAGTYAAGYIMEKSKTKSFKTMLIASFANMGAIYILGITFYYFIANYYLKSPVGIWALILQSLIFTIPGDIVTCFLASAVSQRLAPVLNNSRIGVL